MKRNLAILLLAALACPCANAQNEPGTTKIYLRIGVNLSKLTADAILIDDNAQPWTQNTGSASRPERK